VIFDHDSKFNVDVVQLLTATGLQPKRTSVQAPWQNGTAERWMEVAAREVLDHIIPLNERHLRGLLREYGGERRYRNLPISEQNAELFQRAGSRLKLASTGFVSSTARMRIHTFVSSESLGNIVPRQ
jgi:hypothetical protein